MLPFLPGQLNTVVNRILIRILVETRSAKKRIEEKTGETSIIIVLLGAGGRAEAEKNPGKQACQ